MVKGAYGPIKQITLDPSRCSRSNAATVGRPFYPSTPLYLAVRKRTGHEPILPIKNWLVQLLAVLAKRLMDKGPQFVGAHVLKVRKLARLISLRPTRKADHRSGQSIEAAGEGVSRL
jgi:hypothetical protein